MLSDRTVKRIDHLYSKCLPDMNDWEKQFMREMYERVVDAQSQNAPLDEYYISRLQAEKVDQIWEKVGL